MTLATFPLVVSRLRAERPHVRAVVDGREASTVRIDILGPEGDDFSIEVPYVGLLYWLFEGRSFEDSFPGLDEHTRTALLDGIFVDDEGDYYGDAGLRLSDIIDSGMGGGYDHPFGL